MTINKRSLRNLSQNRNKTDQELNAAMNDNPVADIELLTKFKDPEEKKLSRLLLHKYLNEFDIESISDRNTLAQLIYFEVNQVRIQQKLNEIYNTDARAISQDLLEVMQKNAELIIKLKSTLGLSKPKDRANSLDALQHLMRRHTKWRLENQASRTLKCPHCFQLIWLKIRTEAWEAQKHPFFQDTFLYNRTLLDNLGRTVVINRDFIARIFNTSTDYIDWIIQKIHGNIPIDENDRTKS